MSTSNSGLELVTFSSNFLSYERIEPRDSSCKMGIYSSPLLLHKFTQADPELVILPQLSALGLYACTMRALLFLISCDNDDHRWF